MYTKLILKNIRRSLQDYLIYLITMTICVTLFYSFLSISSSYYHPDIGAEYNLDSIDNAMKIALCLISLCLLFLIHFVNRYMLLRRQKEFALQSLMGMEQRTIAWLFFCETWVMGIISIVCGIFFGLILSQVMNALLLSTYDHPYSFSWMLYPDTLALTVSFFALCFLLTGLFNIHLIRKTKIIDMLSAARKNDPTLEKSRWIVVVSLVFLLFTLWMMFTGVQIFRFYYDSRFPLPVQMLFFSSLALPIITLCWSGYCRLRKNTSSPVFWVRGLFLCAIVNTICAASVPALTKTYTLPFHDGILKQYLLFLLVDLLFCICSFIYLFNSILSAWKNRSLDYRYRGENLFFFGQIQSKLNTTSKTMSIISMTLMLSIFLFLCAPVLIRWSFGFLESRSIQDIQISSNYNQVYDKNALVEDRYELVTNFLHRHNIPIKVDCPLRLYLPRQEEFQNRMKYDFPPTAIPLSAYNTLRQIKGYDPVVLHPGEFTTHWRTVATKEEKENFLNTHTRIQTDGGELTLSPISQHDESIGTSFYNSYTNVTYIFEDSLCRQLLPVESHRYIMTQRPLSYEEAQLLQREFFSHYSQTASNAENYFLRLRTLQINDTKANAFMLQSSMFYAAVMLMVICLTVLSLQQLMDAAQYRYRFGLLQQLGVDRANIQRLVRKQLYLWFGLPVLVAIFVVTIIFTYFLQTISAEISAYIGAKVLLTQLAISLGILMLLLLGYFLSTWLLFQKSLPEYIGQQNH